MQYMLKQKVWSFTDTYTINDSAGQLAYALSGAFFSWGDKLTMVNAAGDEVAQIEQRLLSLKPTYDLHRDGRHFATITKEFSWFRESFTLDVPGPNDYSIEGSFWTYDYSFSRGGSVVATVSKELFSWADTYGIDIAPGGDAVSILATAVVIDLICHDDDE